MWICVFTMCFNLTQCAEITSDPYKDVKLAVIEVAVNVEKVSQIAAMNGSTWFPKELLCSKKAKKGI